MKKSLFLLAAFSVLLAGCHTDMWVQPRATIQGESDFFPDRMDSRPKVAGTVARGDRLKGTAYTSGYEAGKMVARIPDEEAMRDLGLTTYKQLIQRGKDRFGIFCSHCHGAVGDGKGMIAQRGLELARPVATYHTDRLRKMPDGHFFDVITNGYGVMFPQNDRIPVEDRWAIVSYVRALQRSQSQSGTVITKVEDTDL